MSVGYIQNEDPEDSDQSTQASRGAVSVYSIDDHSMQRQSSIRKQTSDLRPLQRSPVVEEPPEKKRRMTSTARVPQRRKADQRIHKMESLSVEKLIKGIWEQIHSSFSFDMRHTVRKCVV